MNNLMISILIEVSKVQENLLSTVSQHKRQVIQVQYVDHQEAEKLAKASVKAAIKKTKNELSNM